MNLSIRRHLSYVIQHVQISNIKADPLYLLDFLPDIFLLYQFLNIPANKTALLLMTMTAIAENKKENMF